MPWRRDRLPLQYSWTFPGGQFSSVQLWCFRLSATPWTAAHQASLSITSSRRLLKLMSIESVMPPNHFILCRPLLLLPSIFPSIRVFSSESVLRIRWPEYWSFSFSISPSSEYSGLISFRMGSHGSISKESSCNGEDLGSILRLGRSPGGGHDNPLQYFCMENPHGQRSLVTVLWVTKNWTRLSD